MVNVRKNIYKDFRNGTLIFIVVRIRSEAQFFCFLIVSSELLHLVYSASRSERGCSSFMNSHSCSSFEKCFGDAWFGNRTWKASNMVWLSWNRLLKLPIRSSNEGINTALLKYLLCLGFMWGIDTVSLGYHYSGNF